MGAAGWTDRHPLASSSQGRVNRKVKGTDTALWNCVADDASREQIGEQRRYRGVAPRFAERATYTKLVGSTPSASPPPSCWLCTPRRCAARLEGGPAPCWAQLGRVTASRPPGQAPAPEFGFRLGLGSGLGLGQAPCTSAGAVRAARCIELDAGLVRGRGRSRGRGRG